MSVPFSFASPAGLAFLAAAAAIVALSLVARHRLTAVVPSLTVWMRTTGAKTDVPALRKVFNWTELVLETLAAACIALALASPFVARAGVRPIGVVVDTSSSMAAPVAPGSKTTRLLDCVSSVCDYLGNLGHGSRCSYTVVEAGPEPRVVLERSPSLRAAATALRSLATSPGGGSAGLVDAVALAVSSCGGAAGGAGPDGPCEVVVLTDAAFDRAHLEALRSSAGEARLTFVLPRGPGQAANIAVTAFSARAVSSGWLVLAGVDNLAPTPCAVTVRVGVPESRTALSGWNGAYETELVSQRVVLDPWEHTQFSVQLPADPGSPFLVASVSPSGAVAGEGDAAGPGSGSGADANALPDDDAAFLVLPGGEAATVAVVGRRSRAYLRAALTTLPGVRCAFFDGVDDYQAAVEVGPWDVTIFDSVDLPPPTRQSSIYVNCFPAGLPGVPGQAVWPDVGSVRAYRTSVSHPVTRDISLWSFDASAAKGFPRIPGADTLFAAGDVPVIQAAARGANRVTVLAFDLPGSTLVRSPWFPVLLWNLLSWSCPAKFKRVVAPTPCGATVSLEGIIAAAPGRSDPGDDASGAEPRLTLVRDPAGRVTRWELPPQEVSFRDTRSPGFYLVTTLSRDGNELARGWFAVSLVDRDESDPRTRWAPTPDETPEEETARAGRREVRVRASGKVPVAGLLGATAWVALVADLAIATRRGWKTWR